MTLRERILAVYRGETPDVVPCMLDLSHWFYHHHRRPWDLSISYDQPERELIGFHREMGVGFYLPNLGSFFAVDYPDDVSAQVRRETSNGRTEIVWRYETPLGNIERRRVWEEGSYSWAVSRWGIHTELDLRVLGYALSQRRFRPFWDRYQAWVDCVGDIGVVYLPVGYSAMGQLMNLWMGVEATIYATADMPETLHEVVEAINANNLELIDLLAASPAEIILLGDNFSSDIQPPRFFETWSRGYYVEAVRRLHAAGKFVAVHIDGRLRGALAMIRDTGVDAADAVTPAPTGDLTADQCRSEAGTEFLLSGGVPPALWLPNVSEERFRRSAMEWLGLRRMSPRLIANAGDQVPPGADPKRIEILRDLVESHGRF